MSENKRRRSSSTGFWGRIRQSARHIENEAKEGARRVEHSAAEGARRVQHDAQERVRNMTPKQKNGWKMQGSSLCRQKKKCRNHLKKKKN